MGKIMALSTAGFLCIFSLICIMQSPFRLYESIHHPEVTATVLDAGNIKAQKSLSGIRYEREIRFTCTDEKGNWTNVKTAAMYFDTWKEASGLEAGDPVTVYCTAPEELRTNAEIYPAPAIILAFLISLKVFKFGISSLFTSVK